MDRPRFLFSTFLDERLTWEEMDGLKELLNLPVIENTRAAATVPGWRIAYRKWQIFYWHSSVFSALILCDATATEDGLIPGWGGRKLMLFLCSLSPLAIVIRDGTRCSFQLRRSTPGRHFTPHSLNLHGSWDGAASSVVTRVDTLTNDGQ